MVTLMQLTQDGCSVFNGGPAFACAFTGTLEGWNSSHVDAILACNAEIYSIL